MKTRAHTEAVFGCADVKALQPYWGRGIWVLSQSPAWTAGLHQSLWSCIRKAQGQLLISLHFSLVKTSHPLLRRNEVSVLSLASSQHSPLRIWIPGANRPGIGTFYWGFPLVSWSLVSHQVDRRTARARTLVLAAGPAQLMGQWGAGAQGNDVRKGLTGSDIPFQNNYLYKTDTLQMYSKDRDIHTYVQMLYIHLFTMTYMLLRSL